MNTMKSFFNSLAGRICCILLGLAIGVGGYFVFTALRDPHDSRMLDGVTIGGVDVGNMTRSEAKDALNAALEESLYTQPLTVHLPEESITLSPEQSKVKVDVRKAVKDAYSYGRDLETLDGTFSLLPYLSRNDEEIRGILDAYASRWNTSLCQPEWTLTGTQPDLSTATFDSNAAGQTLELTRGVPSMHLDIDFVCQEILTAYSQGIELCAAGDFSITPLIQPEELPAELDLEAIYAEIAVAATNDSLDMKTYGFVNGTYGYAFDLEQAKTLLAEAKYGATVSVPMVITEPEILGDGVYFRDQLGHCETKHTDDENRNTNLRLLCEALDGVILQPGDEFSFNGTVGERTEAKGYKPATAYSGKSMIKDIGGGVCQGSTTLYNCALLADLEVLERVCHGAKVGYVPLGLDAAVNWNTKTDLRFRNNFNFPMMIKAEVSDGYMKMQILGTDEKDYYIEMRAGNSKEGDITYAVSYKYKFDKTTGEQISKDREAFSTYYPLS